MQARESPCCTPGHQHRQQAPSIRLGASAVTHGLEMRVEVPCCPVTEEPYEVDGPNLPRILPCGHTVSHAALEQARYFPPCQSLVNLVSSGFDMSVSHGLPASYCCCTITLSASCHTSTALLPLQMTPHAVAVAVAFIQQHVCTSGDGTSGVPLCTLACPTRHTGLLQASQRHAAAHTTMPSTTLSAYTAV